MGLLLLLLDGALVAVAANRLLARLRPAESNPGLRAMAFLTAAALLVIASVWALSAAGFLSARGFLALHAVLAAVLFLAGRGPLLERRSRPRLFRLLFPGGAAGAVLGCLVAILIAYALVLALASFPGTFDSQTYRLSRVGYWLQEHRVVMHFGDDSRLYYMPVHAEFLMLWVTCFFPTGYALVSLPQFLGGLLCLLAVFELGRLAGLTRGSRLVALALLLGMPNLFLQFSTSQSDLLTAGFFNVGLAFVWRTLAGRSGRDALWAGLALGIAIGAKSTFVYWLPGLAVWFALLWLIERPDRRRAWLATFLIAALTLAIGGWKYADNLARFGNPFAPRAEIERIHQHGGGRLGMIRFVAEMHFWQLLQVNSNPAAAAPLLRPLARAAGDFIARSNPDQAGDFRAIRADYRDGYVYEDIVSFGLLAPLLAAMALAADLAASRSGRRPGRAARLAMAGSLLVFFAFFFTQQNPNAWNYRFFIILGPFLAVLAAAALPVRRFGRGWGPLAFALAVLQLAGAADLQSRNILGGWRALAHRDQVGTIPLFDGLARQARALPPSVRSVAVALPVDRWLAPYFRLGDGRRYRIVSLERLQAQFRSPADYLAAEKVDAVITEPGAFGAGPWPGVGRSESGLPGAFARDAYFRD